MCSGPCVATTIAWGGLFGLTRAAFGRDCWKVGAPELNAATSRTMKIARQTTQSTARRPPRLESALLRRRARGERPVGREETIGSTVPQSAPGPPGVFRPKGRVRLAPRAGGPEDPDPTLDPARRPAA